MSNDGSYNPHAIEADIYRFWEAGGYFHARPNPQRQPYVIDIPLPNVTGALHLGHAINNTLQDILIRRARMQGYEAMWMPGTDHAGIATQAVVEKKLKEEQNLTRHELGREGLVAKIWEWKEKYGEQILRQLRRMGCSCDWERTRFTLDEVCARAVYEVFFRWFKDGLIYRGLRLVNWDAHLQTAVADDEVIYETVRGHFWHYRYPIEGRQATGPGARPFVDYIVIATTRPETMLGDTAVAVHPDDERYRHLVGKNCVLPLLNRPIPIIADGLLAKKEMGTGCVKVTPGHDPKDYQCAIRNRLPMINILTPDGRINENGGPYAGLDRYEARAKIVEDLQKLGLMEKIEDYETEIGHSDRSKTPIEPMLSEQWFVKMSDLAELAMEAVRDGRVQFFPARYARTVLDWLGEKRDWCISRQLWWGHRIPVWSRQMSVAELRSLLKTDGKALAAAGADPNICVRVVSPDGSNLVYADAASLAPLRELEPQTPLRWYVCLRNPEARWPADELTIGQRLERDGFERDPDVLDTWFSSALWPFSTLGWPHDSTGDREAMAGGAAGAADSDKARAAARGQPNQERPTRADLEYFYPTTVLVTGREIITLWVARMIITGLYFTGRVPFQHVYIHPNIQDGQGRRMSKSLGNGVDPLDIIELYGTDALRFTMAQVATETQDARMPVKPVKLPDGRVVNTSERFEPARNFCNKIWQAATGFVLPNLLADGSEPAGRWEPQPLRPEDLTVEDRWIVSRLGGCIAEVDRRFARYQLNEVANLLYSFFWGDFCDWYIELIKPRLFEKDAAGRIHPRTDFSAAVARQVLVWVLDQSLRLLHPVMPFVTEALWNKLGQVAPRRGLTEIHAAEPALIIAAWPNSAACRRDPDVERKMAALQDVIRALRDTLARINASRAAAKTPAIGKLPRALIRADEPTVAVLRQQLPVLQRLGRCEAVEIGSDFTKPTESATQVLSGLEVYVQIQGLMEIEAERKRLQKQRDQLFGQVEQLTLKLAGEVFLSRAPAAVVEQERQRLAELKTRLATVERNLADLGPSP